MDISATLDRLYTAPRVHLAVLFYAIVCSDDPVTQLTDPDGKAPM
jgi:hypothetical protein